MSLIQSVDGGQTFTHSKSTYIQSTDMAHLWTYYEKDECFDYESDLESVFSRDDRVEEDRQDVIHYNDEPDITEEEFFYTCHEETKVIPLLRQEETWTEEDIINNQVNEMYPPDMEIIDERYDSSRWNVQCYPECQID